MQTDSSATTSVASANQAVKGILRVRGVRVTAFSCPQCPPDNVDVPMHASLACIRNFLSQQLVYVASLIYALASSAPVHS
jgi:hypothetical protein